MNAHAHDKTTLLLSAEYWPVMFVTASQAFSQLMRNRVVAMVRNRGQDDLVGMQPYYDSYAWRDWQYVDRSMVPDSTPFLRSPQREWPVPTVARILVSHKGANPHSRKHSHRRTAHVPFKFVLEFYDHTCQLCRLRLPRTSFSREHVFPRHMGGSNDDFNISLTCVPCNTKKGPTYPYKDVLGQELKGKPIPTWLMGLASQVEEIKPEWEPFFYDKKVRRRKMVPRDMTEALPRLEMVG